MSSSNFVSLIFNVTSTLWCGEKSVKQNINREITKLLPIPTALLMSNKNSTTVWIVKTTLMNRSKTWKKANGVRPVLRVLHKAVSYRITTPPPPPSVTSLPHLRLHSCPLLPHHLTQSYYNLDTLTTPSPLPIYGTVTAFPFLALATPLHPRHNPSSTTDGSHLVHSAFLVSLLLRYVEEALNFLKM